MGQNGPFIAFLFAVLISCNSEDQNNTLQYHPMEDRIPYQQLDVPRIVIETEENEKENLSRNLVESASFLDYFDISEARIINEFLPDDSRMSVKSIDENRLLILSSQTLLHEYDLSSQKWTEIAGEGRGPGDIMYATDITLENQTAYISTQDFKIHSFKCESVPCIYDSTIPIKGVRPYSVISQNGELTVMAPASGEPNPSVAQDSLSILHNISKEGEITRSFGQMYDVDGMWILTMNLNDGKIRTINSPGVSFLQYFSMMPNLYLFNSDEQLDKVFSFRNFLQGYTRLNTKSMTSYSPDKAWTFIDNVVNPKGAKAIIKLQQILDPMSFDDRGADFYLVDLESEDQSFIGRIHHNKEKVWFTNHHVIIKSDEQWSVYNYRLKE